MDSIINLAPNMSRSKGPSNWQPNPFLYCVFCHTRNHSSHKCNKFNTNTKFWEKILEERRCKNCLRLFHRSNQCYDRTFCNLVGCRRIDKHSEVLCKIRYSKNYHLNAEKRYFGNHSSWFTLPPRFQSNRIDRSFPLVDLHDKRSPSHNFEFNKRKYSLPK